MRVSVTGIVILGVLAVAATVAVVRTLPPTPLPHDAPAHRFSAERAALHVEAIAGAPRPTGSTAAAAARGYVLGVLAALGIEAAEHADGDLVNVVARLPGTATSDAVLLTAHLDSTPDSPGAMDDASGVATLLETARMLAVDGPRRNAVLLLFTDHEEGGLLGARAFIARDPWAGTVRVAIGLDAGGVTGPVVLSATSPRNAWLVGQLVDAGVPLVGSSAVTALASSSTDVGRVFLPAGFTGVALDLYWDKGRADGLADLDLASLQDQGDHVLPLVERLATQPSLADQRTEQAVWVGVLRAWTIAYPAPWNLPLGAALVAAFVAVLGLARWRGRATLPSVLGGTAVFAATLVLAAVPAIVLEFVVGRWVPEVTADWDNRRVDQLPEIGVIVAASVLLALVPAMLPIRRPGRQRTSGPDLMLGGLLLPVAGSMIALVVLPGLGFVVPLLLVLVAVLGAWLARPRVGGVAAVAAAVAVVVLVLPTIVLGLFSNFVLSLAALGALVAILRPLVFLTTEPEVPA